MQSPRRHAGIGLLVVGTLLMGCSGPVTSRQSTPGAAAAPAASDTPGTTGSSPASTSSRAPLPAGLVFSWIGTPREIPGLDQPAVSAVIEIDATTIGFNANDNGQLVLVSRASAVDAQTLRFEIQGDGSGCHRGDAGTYSYQLSASGRGLSLDLLDDPCPARAAALSGSWNRAGNCPAGGVCLGDMDAGRHVSAIFTPFVPPSTWRYDYGRFAFTVPEGWVNLEDGKDDYVLAAAGAPPDTDILLIAGVGPHIQDSACSELAPPEPGVGTDPQSLAKWIRTLPGLVTTKQAGVEVGGIRGVTLDVSVSPTSTQTCPFSGERGGAQLFSPFDPKAEFDFGLWGTGRLRLLLLDLGHQRTLMVDIEARDKASWDALVPTAMPIVGSFTFSR